MNTPRNSAVVSQADSIEAMYRLFGETPPPCAKAAAETVPEPYRSLLDHERHMTVALEDHHHTSLNLVVKGRTHTPPFYARQILLLGGPDLRVVLFGLMRFDLRQVAESVQRQILEESIPLGRILISHGVLRQITAPQLLRIDPDAELRRDFGLSAAWSGSVYGRLATILCNDTPAVDLLEVLPPA